jgi:hypothetical protein
VRTTFQHNKASYLWHFGPWAVHELVLYLPVSEHAEREGGVEREKEREREREGEGGRGRERERDRERDVNT